MSGEHNRSCARGSGHGGLWGGGVVALLLCLLFALAAELPAQEEPTQPRQQGRWVGAMPEINTLEELERFLRQFLTDRTRRRDPFTREVQEAQQSSATYQLQTRPRPASGFGRYDIDDLTLQAIWNDGEQITAVFRAPDQKLFIVSVGDEAYDGRIVEINIEQRYVRFMQELRRVGQQAEGQPVVRYEPKIVRLRR